jgi:hypothetical protein
VSEFRRISSFVLAYVLWLLSVAIGALVLLQARDTVLTAITMSTYNRLASNSREMFYASLQVRAMDQWSYLLLGILVIVFIVVVEFLYRTGLQAGKLRLRVVQITAIEFFILFFANLLTNVMLWQVNGYTWSSLFYPLLELLTTGIFVWLWSDLRRQKLDGVKPA